MNEDKNKSLATILENEKTLGTSFFRIQYGVRCSAWRSLMLQSLYVGEPPHKI